MKLIQSKDFIINRFYLTKSVLFCIFSDDDKRIRLDKLELEYDYDIFTSETKPGILNLVVSFSIRCNEDEKPGYYFDVEAVGEFTLKNAALRTDKIRKQYILFTALPVVINSLRTYLQNITSMHYFGTYKLPSVDLMKLIESKQEDV
ncbi:MAG: hypothetical protein B6D61_03190 [Bacteroidetes bacterium 4484_249]|jgi:preprotein translocase subunit SecB|nr:MAG: hypothetical protein B6D61_03190 [Bacteroidetes bacterium 4484_249]